MRKLYLLVTLILAAPALSQAQQSSAGQSFTLEQAVEYALLNSPTAKNATLDERIADGMVKETRGIGLPQISATVGIQHNQKLPRFFSQYNPDQQGFIDLSAIPGIQAGDVVALQNFFQLKSAGNAQLSVTQILFNGSYLVGLQAANAYRELSTKQKIQSKRNYS